MSQCQLPLDGKELARSIRKLERGEIRSDEFSDIWLENFGLSLRWIAFNAMTPRMDIIPSIPLSIKAAALKSRKFGQGLAQVINSLLEGCNGDSPSWIFRLVSSLSMTQSDKVAIGKLCFKEHRQHFRSRNWMVCILAYQAWRSCEFLPVSSSQHPELIEELILQEDIPGMSSESAAILRSMPTQWPALLRTAHNGLVQDLLKVDGAVPSLIAIPATNIEPFPQDVSERQIVAMILQFANYFLMNTEEMSRSQLVKACWIWNNAVHRPNLSAFAEEALCTLLVKFVTSNRLDGAVFTCLAAWIRNPEYGGMAKVNKLGSTLAVAASIQGENPYGRLLLAFARVFQKQLPP